MVKKNIVEKIENQIFEQTKDYVKSKLVRKALRIGEVSILVILGFFLISFGIAKIIGFYYPFLDFGLNFVLLGLIFLIIGFFLKI